MSEETETREAVKNYFRAYKRAIIRRVGRGPMDNFTIDEIGRNEFGKKWAGVHASDMTEKLLAQRNCYAVLNTATSKGRGSHWIGLYVSPNEAYVYDSFGRSPKRVAWRLAQQAANSNVELLGTDPAQEQRGLSAVCGQSSLAWLLTVRDLGIKATAAAV